VLLPLLGAAVDWSEDDLSVGAWLVLVEDGAVWSSFSSQAPNSSAHANIAAVSVTKLPFFIVIPPLEFGHSAQAFRSKSMANSPDHFWRVCVLRARLLITERAASLS
jgi:hypothetical protein